MQTLPKEFTGNAILFGPIIIGAGLWQKGTFYTVGFDELANRKMNVDYEFYKMKFVLQGDGKLVDKAYFVNINGQIIDYEPKYCELCAYITLDGIVRRILQELIKEPNILDKCY